MSNFPEGMDPGIIERTQNEAPAEEMERAWLRQKLILWLALSRGMWKSGCEECNTVDLSDCLRSFDSATQDLVDRIMEDV